MDRTGVLKIVRGAKDIAKARGNRNRGSESPGRGKSKSKSRQNKGLSRVRGQVGVAVRRDDNNGPLQAYGSRYDRDDDHKNQTADSGEDTLGPRTASTQQAAGTQPPPDTTDYGMVDLTSDSPDTTAAVDSSSDVGRKSAPSLGSWLLPAPPPKAAAAAAKGSNRRRQRPLQDTESSELPRSTRTWATLSQRQDDGTPGGGQAGGDGSLAAWLEPRQSSASRERRGSTPRRSGASDMVAGHGSSGHSDSSGDEDDSGRWMSDRLEGLDPNGAARAKDSWTDRERRNLTSTDVALGAKRKSRGGSRGWKTKASGSKVFVAPGRGGGAAVVSSGQAAFRSSKGFVGGDGGKKKRKR